MKSLMAALGLIATVGLAGTPADPELQALSTRLDELYRSDSSRASLTMQIKTPHFERELEMNIWTRGKEHALIRIVSPRKEKGISTLKVENEMWNYLPKIGKTIRVPPSMMAASWMGSDFTNDDLVREASWTDDYNIRRADHSPDGQTCAQFDAKPDAAVPWPKVIACLDATKLVPTTLYFYDDKDRKAREMVYSDIKELGGMQLPSKMTLKPLTKDGHQTVIIYNELDLDVKHNARLFTLSNLKRDR